jgi:hypothetical protein
LSDAAPPASPEVPAVAVPPAGFDGFLGTRASIGMDVVLVGLLATLPVLVLSIAAVRARRYAVHKALQLGIVAALLAAIVVFEVDIRLFPGRPPARSGRSACSGRSASISCSR